MRIMQYIKENWLSWFVSIILVFPIIFNEEISIFSKNIFLIFLTQSFPFIIAIIIIYLLNLFYLIDENLWGEFKVGENVFIDKIIRKIKVLFVLIFILNIFWLLMICYDLYYSIQFSYMKTIILLLTPILIIVIVYKEFYSLQKKYNS